MKNNLSKTNYIIVVDFNPFNNRLEDQYLLGWNNKYDWYDTDTCGYEIITPKGNIKKCKSLLIDINKWVSVYVGTEIKDCMNYCNGGNEEGYNCTVCKIEKDDDGEWIVVPAITKVTNRRFKVTITETLKREIYVEAEDKYEAAFIAQDEYYNGDHILDSEDYETTTFEAEEDE